MQRHFARSTLVALSLFTVPVFASPSQKPAPAAKDLQVPGLTRLALGDLEFALVNKG